MKIFKEGYSHVSIYRSNDMQWNTANLLCRWHVHSHLAVWQVKTWAWAIERVLEHTSRLCHLSSRLQVQINPGRQAGPLERRPKETWCHSCHFWDLPSMAPLSASGYAQSMWIWFPMPSYRPQTIYNSGRIYLYFWEYTEQCPAAYTQYTHNWL